MDAPPVRRLGISLPCINQPYTRLPELANLADQAGFDSVWSYEVHRNPFLINALCAGTTQNVSLATGLAAGAARSPTEMANAAADVDELSNGRAILGISTGAQGYADCLHGTDVSRPVPKMREYMQCLQASWDYVGSGDPQQVDGEFYKFQSPPFNPWGGRQLARSRIPIYLGALKPGMCKLAGANADGVIGYLMSPGYVRQQWLPHVVEGAVGAGRNPDEVDKVLEVLTSVDEDRETALRLARINVGLYVAHPVSHEIVKFEGLTEERDAVLQALMTQGPKALAHTTSDALVKTFSVTGTPDEARCQLADFQEVAQHVVIHIPYMPPISGEESESAFVNAVRFLGRRESLL